VSEPTLLAGASVGELLDQARERLYAIAVNPPRAAHLLAAWPTYQRSCAELLAATIGPRLGNTATDPAGGLEPSIRTALALHAHLRPPASTWDAKPDGDLTRAARLIGAAADLVQCTYDRPTGPHSGPALGDIARSALTRSAAELTLTGADLTIRACGVPAPTAVDGRWTSRRLTNRATPLFATRKAAAEALDALRADGKGGDLDRIRAKPVAEATQGPLGRLESALAVWTSVSLDAAKRPAVSTAEFQRTTVEARQLIAFAAAITHAARDTGLTEPAAADQAMARLQRAGSAWAAATTVWTHFTTGVPPREEHVTASLELQAALRAATRDPTGQWLSADQLATRLPLRPAAQLADVAIRNVVEVGRQHRTAAQGLIQTGRLYVLATALPPTDHLAAARLRQQHVVAGPSVGASIDRAYRLATSATPIRGESASPSQSRVSMSTVTRRAIRHP